MNSVPLTITMIYAVIHALFVSILFVYHVSLNSFIRKQKSLFLKIFHFNTAGKVLFDYV